MKLPYESASDPASDRPMPGARAALVLLLLINLMNYVDRQILSAVEEPIGKEFGVTSAATGWLATSFLLAYMVFSPVFGVLADRMSRWAIVGVGVVLWSLASGGSGAVTSFGLLIGMRLLIGIGEAAYGPVAPTIISDLYPVSMRGKVLAWFNAAIPVGSALGYVIGGLFPPTHWHWAFYVTVPPGLLLGALCFFKKDRLRSSAAERPKLNAAHYLSLLKTPSYTINCIGMTAMTFALGGIAFFMPRYLTERGQTAAWAKPLFGGLVCLAGLLATVAGGMTGDKLRKRFPGSYFLVSGVSMLIGFPLFLAILITPFPYFWFVLFAAVFCLFFNTGPSNTILANVTKPSIRASAFAFNIFIIHALGDAISPPVIGWVAARFHSMNIAFAVVSLAILASGLVWMIGARFLEADTAIANRDEIER